MKKLLIVCAVLTVVGIMTLGTVQVAANNHQDDVKNISEVEPFPPPINDISEADFSKCIKPGTGVSDHPGAPKLSRLSDAESKSGDSSRGQLCWGTWIYDTDGVEGVYSVNTAYTNVSLPDSLDAVYSPTLLGPGACPLEVVTMYRNFEGAMTRVLTIYDHASPPYNDFDTIDASFMSTYTNGGYYTTEILKYNGEWYAMIYNWSTSSWEIMYGPQDDKGWSQDGWCMFESYNLDTGTTWPSLPSTKAYYLRIYLDGDWPYVTDDYGEEMTPAGYLPYSRDFYDEYYSWYCGG